jgi:hypothetical protein
MIGRSWTRPASIEETLALWAASLREIKKWIRPLFNQDRVARNAGLFLEGFLGDEQRKTGWMRAEAAGDPGPWRQQAILGRREWDADALRDIVRDYVIEHLADDDAVLVIDETGFLKQGKASCGVARQYTGSAGKITKLARSGEITDPCPVPLSLTVTIPSSRTPALSHFWIRRMIRRSPTRCSTNLMSHSWLTVSKNERMSASSI